MTLWNSAAGIAIVALVWIWSSQCDASSHTSRPYEDVVYNPLISIHYPEHKPLFCRADGKIYPDTIRGPIPSDLDYGAPFVDYGFKGEELELHEDRSELTGLYKVKRTITFTLDSGVIQRHYVGISPYKTSRQEFSYDGSSFVARPNGRAVFTSRIYYASKFIVDYIVGESTLCGNSRGFEDKFELHLYQPEVKPGTCDVTGTADSDVLKIDVVSKIRSYYDYDDSCTDHLGANWIPGNVLNGIANLVGIEPPPISPRAVNLRSLSFPRSQQLDYAFCPAGVETASKTDPKTLEVSLAEVYEKAGIDDVCTIFAALEQKLKLQAEVLKPTTSVQIRPGDSPWRVARRLWGDGRLMVFLSDRSQPNWHVGQIIQIPRIGALTSNPNMVRVDDSLWAMAKRLGVKQERFRSLYSSIQPRPPSADKIFPFATVGVVPSK
jgi:hypothetical protein